MGEDLVKRLLDHSWRGNMADTLVERCMQREEAAAMIREQAEEIARLKAAEAEMREMCAKLAIDIGERSGRDQDGEFYVGEEAARFAGSVVNEIAAAIRALAEKGGA